VLARLSRYPAAGALAGFAAVFLFFALLSPDTFLSHNSLSSVLTSQAVPGIAAIGIALLMIAGQFDLSVGAVLGVASLVFLHALMQGGPALLAALLGLGTGALLGLLNGLLLVWTGIPSFIITLGTMLLYRALCLTAIAGGSILRYADFSPADPVLALPGTSFQVSFFSLLNGQVEWLAGNYRVSILWWFLLVLLFSALLNRTRFGNALCAVGGNPEAARAQGVAVGRVRVQAFVLSGLLAALAGIVQVARLKSVDPLRGEGLELEVIAAVVIGGTLLSGGYGSVFGAAVGTALTGMLRTGLVLLGVPANIFRGAIGALMIGAVVINSLMRRPQRS
jgi:simple sugar transport system permease protein